MGSKELADKFFFQQATLDEECFFAALSVAGYPDLSSSPLAPFIYRGSCYDPDRRQTSGVLLSTLRSTVQMLKETLHTFSKLAGPEGLKTTDTVGCLTMGLSSLSPAGRILMSKDDLDRYKDLMDVESFARYDRNQDGVLDETDICAFVLTIRILCEVYLETAENAQLGMDITEFNQALQRMGLPNVERILQGQFVHAVFERADMDRTDRIVLREFIRAGTRLTYPVTHESRIRACLGYPGWNVLSMKSSAQQAEGISQFVSTLQTGDLLLMQGGDDNPMGRYIKYSMNTPWSHVAVIVKRSPLGGIANEKTEAVLQTFPFRRAAHNFCSPGYCRCFDLREGDFPPSRIAGCSEIGMLESTGEGIHLYDAAHRLLESQSKWRSIAVAKLHDVPDRDNVEKINSFIESVRGGIYSVAKDELKAAMSFHSSLALSKQKESLPEGHRSSDDFCASLAMRFYHHMGWIDDSRPCNSVMPSDFDVYTQYSECKNPVQLLQGRIGHLELVMSPELGVKLPLKLPKQK